MSTDKRRDPHGRGRIARTGVAASAARMAVILGHGRGGSPEDMLGLAEHLALPDVAFIAPEAAGRSWWPGSFLAPIEANQPGLRSGLAAIEAIYNELAREGVESQRVAVLGFSQGACLALEYAARTGHAMGAIIALSGGLVGSSDADAAPRDDLYGYADKHFDYATSLDEVPVFLGCHERDPHIPLARVRQSEAVFKALGATVTARIHPGTGHGVSEQDIRFVRGLLE